MFFIYSQWIWAESESMSRSVFDHHQKKKVGCGEQRSDFIGSIGCCCCWLGNQVKLVINKAFRL